MRARRSTRWDQLAPPKKVAVMLLVSLRVSSTVAALADLAGRRPEQVRGSKRLWAAVILGVDFLGPLLYYRRGRVDAS